MPRIKPITSCRALLLCTLLVSIIAFAAYDLDSFRDKLRARFPESQVSLLNAWFQAIGSAKTQSEHRRLKLINDFVNRTIIFESDSQIWSQSDYWATPLETLGMGRGDCEDIAIMKYVSLRMAGVPGNKLRLIYARARLPGQDDTQLQAHMVLAYYTTPISEPLVLDNLNPEIVPASQRRDLRPVFSFNSEGIYPGVLRKNDTAPAQINRLSRWEDAWRRIFNDGYLTNP